MLAAISLGRYNKGMAKVPNKKVTVTAETEFHSYIQMVRNAVGTRMFSNFYALDEKGQEFDTNGNGDRGCALFVSSVLVIFKKIGSFHNTVYSTILDMERCGWQRVDEAQIGDILVWEDADGGDDIYSHIGFYVGDDLGISTSTRQQMVVQHTMHEHDRWNKIERVYRLSPWTIGTPFTPATPNANL